MKAAWLAALLLAAAPACAQDWPRLVSGQDRPECKAAFRLAASAFKSSKPGLVPFPVELPPDFGGRLVLGPHGEDLSGGDALEADKSTFTKIPLPEHESRSIYWQTAAVAGRRMVVEEMPHGWRGDRYAVRVVDQAVRVEDYFGVPPERKMPEPLTEGWRAPLVFQQAGASGLWLLYTGEPYDFSANWEVFLLHAAQSGPACVIQFRPQVEKASQLLPSEVQQLAASLDRTLGTGQDEGTLQPTARIRVNVQQSWANAALRPWAMDSPYNSRELVDDNLLKWSRKGPMARRVLNGIMAQYKPAERALAQYYARQLRMPAEEAASTARAVLDNAFRMHYVLPRP